MEAMMSFCAKKCCHLVSAQAASALCPLLHHLPATANNSVAGSSPVDSSPVDSTLGRFITRLIQHRSIHHKNC